ncbi:hypothetical protein [Poseidonocella sp. HB161398]|uniref:hypothetical protein n=1 Tax=Poseidonocella sp. HB161398 TaxID=2320855 RepID=UPI00110829A1|nr:hypothetical protein [Poseidonocella sp. HB161398]
MEIFTFAPWSTPVTSVMVIEPLDRLLAGHFRRKHPEAAPTISGAPSTASACFRVPAQTAASVEFGICQLGSFPQSQSMMAADYRKPRRMGCR